MDTRVLKDSIPPHSDEAEQATLGALLLDWEKRSDVFTLLRPERFYSLQNQLVFKAMRSLDEQTIKGDTLTLINELTKTGDLEKAGGVAYIASLTNTVPTSANILYYAQIVFDRSVRRELIKVSQEIKAASYDEARDSRAILEEAEQKVFNLTDRTDTAEIYNMHDVIIKAVQNIDERYQSKNAYTGIPSGFVKLDQMTIGFQKSELIVIGARPSMGKTALALSMMEFLVVNRQVPCGFFSLEMSYESIGQRLLSQVSGIPGYKLRSGLLRLDEMQQLQNAAGRCYKAPLFIVDTPNMQLLDIRAMARRMVHNQQVKIIFIDYIGLITTEMPDAKVFERVAEITKALKALARELEIPIVALSQVSRDAEGKEPNLAQLRGSGSVEQDADVVIFIHRDRSSQTDEEQPIQEVRLIIAKHRNGATGDVKLSFVKACTRFENLESDAD